MRRTLIVIVLGSVLFSTAGCGTVGTIVPGTAHFGPSEFGIYSGVRRDWHMAAYDALWALDLPFSFALDTALLPVSVAVTLVR